jgi:hypothetical protein
LAWSESWAMSSAAVQLRHSSATCIYRYLLNVFAYFWR